MKKNLMFKLGLFSAALVLVATCLVTGTWAKYTTTVTGTDTATVAKWSIEVNDSSITVASPTVTFDLFNTIKDTDGTNDETDVAANLIAPGTSGLFELKVENLSEVNATYEISFTETNAANVPLQYSTDGTTWKDSIADINVAATAIAMETGTATVKVQWRWVFSTNAAGDAADTTIGQGAPATVTVAATITVTQVD